jgi:hypothetical protein
MIDYDDDNDRKASGSDVGASWLPCTVASIRRGRLQTTSKRLLEEVCLNYAYPIRNKLKDYDMMKSLMTSGTLTRGTELNEDPGRSDTIAFPKKGSHDGLWWVPPTRVVPHI